MFKYFTNLLRQGHTLNYYEIHISYKNSWNISFGRSDWKNAKRIIKLLVKDLIFFYNIAPELHTYEELAKSFINRPIQTTNSILY